jgi:hypothetical protein
MDREVVDESQTKKNNESIDGLSAIPDFLLEL